MALANNLALSSQRGRGGPAIALSASTVLDSASVGTTIGTLSVLGGTGSYTFTLTSNPGSLFSITGTALKVAASLTAGSDAITIRADNGAGGVVTQPFLITVTASGGGGGVTGSPIGMLLAITYP